VAASTLPTRGPVWPKIALSDADRRGRRARASTWPPPIAKPFTIAMTGFGMMADRAVQRLDGPSDDLKGRLAAAPAAPPAPGRIRPGPAPSGRAGAERLVAGAGEHDDADGPGPTAASRNASVSSATVVVRKALRTSGRLMVIHADAVLLVVEDVRVRMGPPAG